jgi:hypothetical protein
MLLPVFAAADTVQGLYSARVPVADRSSESLASAARDALGQVLVKVSGGEEALENPLVVKALPEARSHVQQYGYERDDEDLIARFEFDPSYVTRLVTQARLPLWTANRPRVLVWMVVEQAGQRQFVSLDGTPALAQELLREFEQRGVPAQLPLFDLADATALSLDAAWAMNGNAVLAASQRYDVQNVLVGRVVSTSGGAWLGDWSFLFDGYRLDRSATAPESRGFSREGVALAAETMAERYAVAPSDGSEGLVMMSVTGVNDFGTYAAIVDWLEGLELVEHANVQRISGDRLELALVSLAAADDLARLIALNARFEPVAGTLPGQLDYRWQN